MWRNAMLALPRIDGGSLRTEPAEAQAASRWPPRSRLDISDLVPTLPLRLGEEKTDDERLGWPSRSRFHDDDRRPALWADASRSRRRGDQDRGARGRHDAHPSAVARRRQHQLWPIERRQ